MRRLEDNQNISALAAQRFTGFNLIVIENLRI